MNCIISTVSCFLSFLVKGVAKLPFIEEQRLLDAAARVEDSLTVQPISVLDTLVVVFVYKAQLYNRM